MSDFLVRGRLADLDPALFDLLQIEAERQYRKLILIPSESSAPLAVREALASAFQKVFGGGYQDAFVAKLSPKGDKLVFSSYYGGTSYDYAQDVAVDAAGAVYIAGSTQGTVPVKNPFQKKRSASYEAVVVKIAPDGKSVVYASYLGGSGEDRAYGIAVDSSGNAYVVGWTGSRNFPLKSPGSAELGGSQDGFLTVVEADGAKVRLSTFVGGNYRERVWGVALDEDGGIYLCGYTNSTDFPVKAAYQAEPGGDNDAFVLKIKPLGAARPR